MNELIRRGLTGIILITLLGSLYYWAPLGLSLFFLILMGYIAIFEWPRITAMCGNCLCKFFLLLYLMIPFTLLIALNHSPQRILLVLLFALVFTFDTTSYIAGKLFGRHKILPAISPKKTWEGFIGGIIGTILASYGLLNLMGDTQSLIIIFFALFTCLVAFAGDLFESYIKRKANLKDAGEILPGHGGIFDRFDSIFLTTYFFFLLREPLMRILGL